MSQGAVSQKELTSRKELQHISRLFDFPHFKKRRLNLLTQWESRKKKKVGKESHQYIHTIQVDIYNTHTGMEW